MEGRGTDEERMVRDRWSMNTKTSIGRDSIKTDIIGRNTVTQTCTKAQQDWPSCLIFSPLASDPKRSLPTLFEIQARMKELKKQKEQLEDTSVLTMWTDMTDTCLLKHVVVHLISVA